MFITFLQSIWIILIIAFMMQRFKIGLALYLAYIILVPYLSINIAGIPVQWNFVNLIILLLSIYKFGKNKSFKVDFKPLYPFIIYFIVSLIMILFQDETPKDIQLNFWRIQAMKYLILPFVLWNEMRLDKSSIKLFRNVVITCITIAVFYGLILTTIPGVNPYIMLISSANGAEFNSEYALAFGEGRIFGRISSVFTHPMLFGLFLGLSLIYVFYNRNNINRFLIIPLFITICIDILICGVRSVIGGVVIAIIFFFMQNRNYKFMFYAAIIGIIGYNIILTIPDLATYLGSITDIENKRQAVGGSSIEMRLEQFYGCLKEIQNCIFVGKGFSWTDYYHETFGDHPIILAFESLIFVVICNSGIIGLFLWIYVIYRILKYNISLLKQFSVFPNILLAFYISYSCITGEYGYMQYFILFYILILGETLLTKNENKIIRTYEKTTNHRALPATISSYPGK